MKIRSLRSTTAALTVASLAALGLAACSSGSAASTSSSTPQVAYFMVMRGNTYVSATLDGITAEVEAAGGSVTAFDGKYDPSVQASQIQDAIVSGKYNSFVITAVDNTTLLPAIKQAIDAGIKVVTTTSPVGSDVATNKAQVDGQTLAVLTAPELMGKQIGEATVKACKSLNPCKVVWVGGNPVVSFDKVKHDNFMTVVGQNSNINVVAETNGDYLAEPSRVAVQDILQVHPDVDVVASLGDQMADGAAQAGKSEGKDFVVVGLGASKIAFEGVTSGTWFASVLGLPRTEGVLAGKALIAALKGEKVSPNSVDPVTDAGYGDGLMTKEFLESNPNFTPEWAG